jgi:hypothetical protein
MILMTRESWENSQLSVAKYSRGIRMNGTEYWVVDRFGKRFTAIGPNEPADLVNVKYIQVYKKVGRERFIEALKKDKSINSINTLLRALGMEKKNSKSYERNTRGLFEESPEGEIGKD